MQRLNASTLRPQCPLWVISGHLQCKTSCPLYPNSGHLQRTGPCPLCAKSGHFNISERAKVAIDTKCSIELGRHRERLGRVDDEHYERV
jgi:hypothetical protein